MRVRGGEPVLTRDLENTFNLNPTNYNLVPLNKARDINLAVTLARRAPRKKGRYKRRA